MHPGTRTEPSSGCFGDHQSTIFCKCQSLFLLKSLAVKTSKKQPRRDTAFSAVFMLNEFIHFFRESRGKRWSKDEYSLYISCHRQRGMSIGLFVLMAIAPTREMSLSHNVGQQKQTSIVMKWSILASCLLDVANPPIST